MASGAQSAGDNSKYHYFFIVMNCAIFWLSQIVKIFENYFLMMSYFFFFLLTYPTHKELPFLWSHFGVGSIIER